MSAPKRSRCSGESSKIDDRLGDKRHRIGGSGPLPLIEQLKRRLFSSRSEKLTEEQAAELAIVAGDLHEQEQRPAADSAAVLGAEAETAETEQPSPPRRRRKSRQIPVHLEVQTTVLEPAQAACEHCE